MARRLEVDAEAAFNAGHVIGNDAEELREELSALAREWDDVSHGWTGTAATAFAGIWEEWHEGAAKLVDNLAESARRLARAAVSYEDQDAQSAQTIDLPSVEMGL